MIEIVYYGCGYSDHILSESAPEVNEDYGYYYIKDILGRTYKLPIASTVLFYEKWDGNRSSLSIRYTKALDELEGNETGIAKTAKE
jgi:hypothetical protein